ncbi:MAG TPA: hypothetical protein VIT45_17290 [Allosphingosinicella sp.]
MTGQNEQQVERREWIQPEVRRLEAAGAEDAVGPNVDAINPS